MKYTHLLLLLALIKSGLCFSAEPFDIPSGFVECPIPKAEGLLAELNHSPNEIVVRLQNGKLVAKKRDNSSIVCEDCFCKLKIADGMLKGVNNGEWGGELFYEPDNVDSLNVRIKKGNIVYIFEQQDSLYFIEGLAHLFTSTGTVFQLYRSGNTFRYRKVLDLDDAPEVFLRKGSTLYIAGSGSFYLLKGLQKVVLFEKLFWRGLYPNSLVALDDNTVFVGIRSGFVRLDLKERKATFYKYIGS